MKKSIFILFVFAFCNVVTAQKAPYNVVIDVTSADTIVHQMVIRWVKGIYEIDPNAKVEVVFYGKSLDMITKNKSSVSADIIKITTNKNLSFRVCEIAMKHNKVEKEQLLEGVGTVPDGIYEIISKQHDGWDISKLAVNIHLRYYK